MTAGAQRVTLDALAEACRLKGCSLHFEYDSGYYVSGTDVLDANGKMIPLEDIPLDKVRRRADGFHVDVSGYHRTDATGGDYRYTTVGEAALAGFQLLKRALENG